MSDLLIRGMEMPKRGHTVTITIVGSGQAHVEYYDCRPHVEETIEYAAVPVPPHGRLIDADAPIEVWEVRLSDGDRCSSRNIETTVSKFLLSHLMGEVPPTIIPASEEGE